MYEIPFTCRKVYVGQSGRCVNDRLREHVLSLKSSPAGHIAIHVRNWKCSAMFSNTRILKRFTTKGACKLYEAQIILSSGDACVSATSIAMTYKEFNYLSLMPSRTATSYVLLVHTPSKLHLCLFSSASLFSCLFLFPKE